ncbi:hypothetical protein GGU11DRAFT_792721, partial [Lentinula aff. detonsa]
SRGLDPNGGALLRPCQVQLPRSRRSFYGILTSSFSSVAELTSMILLHFAFISLTLNRFLIYPFISFPLYFPLLFSSCSTILF